MIRAAAFSFQDGHGIYSPHGSSWQKSEAADLAALAGRPIKYLQRFTEEARHCVCAASLVLKEDASGEIGLLAAGVDRTLAANLYYFRDYVANGRSLGRGNLFLYTLPTSVLGEVAVALTLTGPCLFIHNPADPIGQAVRQAEQMIADGEADQMLVIWSDANAAVCLSVQTGEGSFPIELSGDPVALYRTLRQKLT